MKKFIGILYLMVLFTGFCFGQTAEVVDTITNDQIKMDGVAWDGDSIWVITYRSSPLEWRIAQLDNDGSIVTSFAVPVTSFVCHVYPPFVCESADV